MTTLNKCVNQVKIEEPLLMKIKGKFPEQYDY